MLTNDQYYIHPSIEDFFKENQELRSKGETYFYSQRTPQYYFVTNEIEKYEHLKLNINLTTINNNVTFEGFLLNAIQFYIIQKQSHQENNNLLIAEELVQQDIRDLFQEMNTLPIYNITDVDGEQKYLAF